MTLTNAVCVFPNWNIKESSRFGWKYYGAVYATITNVHDIISHIPVCVCVCAVNVFQKTCSKTNSGRHAPRTMYTNTNDYETSIIRALCFAHHPKNRYGIYIKTPCGTFTQVHPGVGLLFTGSRVFARLFYTACALACVYTRHAQPANRYSQPSRVSVV